MKQIFLMSQCQYTRLGLFAVMESAGQHAVQGYFRGNTGADCVAYSV